MARTQEKQLALIKASLERHYKDSTELFLDFTTVREIPVLTTPSAIINAVTTINGIPKGRVTEIYGPYGSAKTTLACQIIAKEQQENPGSCGLYLDYEHALDARYARALGVSLDPSRFVLVQPEYGEQGGEIAKQLLEADLLDWIIIDSAAAMTPKSEMMGEIDIDSSQKGTQASMHARILSILTKLINRGRKPPLIILNQTRAKIQIGRLGTFVDPNPGAREQSAAGNAIKFYSSMRLELEIIKPEGREKSGTKGIEQVYTQNKVRITCIKNKLGPPFNRATFVVEYGKGIDNAVSVLELAEAKLGLLGGTGHFKFEGKTPETTVSGRGRDSLLETMRKNPALLKEIEERSIEILRQEHADALGVEEITVSGQAKQMEFSEGTLVLSSGNGLDTSNDMMPLEEVS